MRKKGFTLIELLGVIIILGIILLIAAPIIKNMTTNGKEELYKIQINNIRDGLKNWAIDNNRLLPEREGEVITITLGQLKMGGYIDSDLENPKSNKCFGNDMLLTVKRYQKNYMYTVDEESGTETDSCDEYIKPYIILNGENITYVEFGDTYTDLGVIAKDASGNDITSSVITTISGSGSTVDTTTIGNKYTITYSVTSDNNTISLNRTVIVRDTTSPVLTIPTNAVLDTMATSFNVMEGVSATDNSGETVEIIAKSNISFGIPGEYIITYTTTDSSGNSTVKNRIVTISPSSIKRLSALAVIDSNLGVTSIPECLTNKTSCEEGTAFAVRVNEKETYRFYAIADTGDEITLIMDRNLGGITAWSNKIDNGPTIALETLRNETSTWEYIAERKYNYTDEGGGNKYQSFDVNMRARLVKYSEVTSEKIGCSTSCPKYLYENLENSTHATYGYWTSSVANFGSNLVHCVLNTGFLNYASADSNANSATTSYVAGVRPVIELFK